MNSRSPTKTGVIAITVPVTEPQKHNSLLSELQLGLHITNVRRQVPAAAVENMRPNSSLHVQGLHQNATPPHCASQGSHSPDADSLEQNRPLPGLQGALLCQETLGP